MNQQELSSRMQKQNIAGIQRKYRFIIRYYMTTIQVHTIQLIYRHHNKVSYSEECTKISNKGEIIINL